MASAVLPNDDVYTSTDEQWLEIFCLIWLDANLHGTRPTEQKLRSIINHLKKFEDVKQCQQFIEQRSQKDRLILIVNGRMGQEIVPAIHHLRQVTSIYIYCMNKTSNEDWTCDYKKVKAVVVGGDELISRIKTDHKMQRIIEDPLSINIYTRGKSTSGVNGQFVFSQVLIDCLLRLKFTSTDRNELIDRCKKEYEGNLIELAKIQEFEQTYTSNKALWWYTRESFFYKTLNAALRTENIHMIYLFRGFISDIYHQLQNYQSQELTQVYRSQMMSSDELHTLKESLGQFISVNSFFSTTITYEKALSFLSPLAGSDHLKRILFEVDADPKMVSTKPFADITAYSNYNDEAEVLFMLGSIFRLESINYNDKDDVWVIGMTLCSDDEHDLKKVLMYMNQKTGSGETNLRTLGKVLFEMGKSNLAEKYFIHFLKQLVSNDPLHISLYEDLGQLASQSGDYEKSIQWHQKALAFKNSMQSNVTFNNHELKHSTHGQIITAINIDYRWKQNGISIAGNNGIGSQLNQLSHPCGICVDDDEQCIYIADFGNHGIIKWKWNETHGQVVAGGNGQGYRLNQLNYPTDVFYDKMNNSLIICDSGNRRVVEWSCENDRSGQIIISDIACSRLTMDNNGNLYVSDYEKNEVRRWKRGKAKGTIVAGGNGKGNRLSQLNYPTFIFVDQDYSVYVSDKNNHRVIKWIKGANEGTIVAGGHGQGNQLTQLYYPEGIILDDLDNLYVVDSLNHRLMRWTKGATEGRIIVGGNEQGDDPDQFSDPIDLSLDREGNLYVNEHSNNRVQKFVRNINRN